MPQVEERVVRPKELKKVVGLSALTARRMEKRGEVPHARRIGKQGIGWLMSDLQTWIESRKQAA